MLSLTKYTKKVDNGSDVKIRLRQKMLIDFDVCGVLDLYAGEGVIRKKVYSNVKIYTGIEKQKIKYIKLNSKLKLPHHAINIDNLRYLETVDISKYNVFDCDAYGSPWLLVDTILKKIKKNALFFITDGSRINFQYRGKPIKILNEYFNLSKVQLSSKPYYNYDKIIRSLWVKFSKKYNFDILKYVAVPKKKKQVWYYGVEIKYK